jgi:hypothetical protein
MPLPREVLALAVACAGAALSQPARAEVSGATVDDVRLKTLDGGVAPLVERASAATVVLFFRPGHDRSVDALRALGGCQGGLSRKPVRLVGVVSGGDPAADVRAAVASAQVKLPVLLDEGDALYAGLGVRAHPSVFVVDRARRVVATEPYRQVGLCDAVRARVQLALGEISGAQAAQVLSPEQSRLPESPADVAPRHVKLGRKLLASGAVAAAHENARKSLAIQPSAAAWALEGDAFKAEGSCAKALEAYDAALRLDGSEPAALAGRKACAR